MRRFEHNELVRAKTFAAAGGQALQLWYLARLDQWRAYLFDQDDARLGATAIRLGVWSPNVENRGQADQHVELWGPTLQSAIAEAG